MQYGSSRPWETRETGKPIDTGGERTRPPPFDYQVPGGDAALAPGGLLDVSYSSVEVLKRGICGMKCMIEELE